MLQFSLLLEVLYNVILTHLFVLPIHNKHLLSAQHYVSVAKCNVGQKQMLALLSRVSSGESKLSCHF